MISPKNGSHITQLSELPVGAAATLHTTDLAADDLALLEALGLTDGSVLRVCRQGEPCIVEVRSTRIGLARTVAHRIYVASPGEATLTS